MMVFGKLKEPQTLLNMDTILASTPFSIDTDRTKGNTDGTKDHPNKTSTSTKTT